jgi:8-amino-7-oxononanoate synthase
VRPDVLIGTFGKSFGVHGAFATGPGSLRTFLWNRARSFVFSTATSPALAATLLERLRTVAGAESARSRLGDLAVRLETLCRACRLQMPPGRHGPIFPILLGSPEAALAGASHLASRGILAPAIRPPTVPDGQSRVRISLTTSMRDEDIERIGQALLTLPGGFT